MLELITWYQDLVLGTLTKTVNISEVSKIVSGLLTYLYNEINYKVYYNLLY